MSQWSVELRIADAFRRAALCLSILFLFSAPAAVDCPGAEAAYRSVLIAGVPFERQKPDFCGEACAAMWLQKLGHRVDQDYVFDRSGVGPAEGRGCDTRDLRQALESIGFEVGPTWYPIAAGDSLALENLWAALHADLLSGVPSIVCMRTGDAPGAAEHFRLVLGYDAAGDEVVYHEPAEARGDYRRMQRSQFLSLWPLKYEPQRWTVVRLRLAAGRLQGPMAASEGFSPADFAQHMIQLRRKLPEGFTALIEPPFVVIGDDPPGQVRRYAEGTVRWAVKLW